MRHSCDKVRLLVVGAGTSMSTSDNDNSFYVSNFTKLSQSSYGELDWMFQYRVGNFLPSYQNYVSGLSELHVPQNWLCNFVKHQKLKYFSHIKRHNRFRKVILEGILAEKRGRGKPQQRREKDRISCEKH